MFFKSFQFKLASTFVIFGLILFGITFNIYTKVLEDTYLSHKTDLFYEKITAKSKQFSKFLNSVELKLDALSKNVNFKRFQR